MEVPYTDPTSNIIVALELGIFFKKFWFRYTSIFNNKEKNQVRDQMVNEFIYDDYLCINIIRCLTISYLQNKYTHTQTSNYMLDMIGLNKLISRLRSRFDTQSGLASLSSFSLPSVCISPELMCQKKTKSSTYHVGQMSSKYFRHE